jgi:hypothetical protein
MLSKPEGNDTMLERLGDEIEVQTSHVFVVIIPRIALEKAVFVEYRPRPRYNPPHRHSLPWAFWQGLDRFQDPAKAIISASAVKEEQ